MYYFINKLFEIDFETKISDKSFIEVLFGLDNEAMMASKRCSSIKLLSLYITAGNIYVPSDDMGMGELGIHKTRGYPSPCDTGVPEHILSRLEINFIISTLKIMSNRNLFSIKIPHGT